MKDGLWTALGAINRNYKKQNSYVIVSAELRHFLVLAN